MAALLLVGAGACEKPSEPAGAQSGGTAGGEGGARFPATTSDPAAQARHDLMALRNDLSILARITGEVPGSLEALTTPGPGGARLREQLGPDPWGTGYRYERSDAGIVLASSGPDRAPGTGDDVVVEATTEELMTLGASALAGPHGAPGGPPPQGGAGGAHGGMGGAHGGAGDPHAGVPGMGGPHAGMPPGMGGGPGADAPRPGADPRPVTPSGERAPTSIEGLGAQVPVEWVVVPPASSMRKAQLVLPGPAGNGELVVFRFAGGAGGVEANLQRWAGQFKPEGGASPEVAREVLDVGALKVTFVQYRGTYAAAMMPGQPGPGFNEAGWMMLAAIVEGAGDPYYFKLIGPAGTLELWREAFVEMLRSLQVLA